MKLFLLLIPFLVSCVSMKTVKINKETQAEVIEAYYEEKVEIVDNIPEIKIAKCNADLSILDKVNNIEKGTHRNLVVKKLGLPNYEAADYKREQTVFYGDYNKEQKAWCYFVVITYTKDWKSDRVSIYSAETKKNKLEHIFD